MKEKKKKKTKSQKYRLFHDISLLKEIVAHQKISSSVPLN